MTRLFKTSLKFLNPEKSDIVKVGNRHQGAIQNKAQD